MLRTGLYSYRKEAFRGFTLFAPMRGNKVFLIDMNGDVVHTWQLPSEVGTYGELLPNGNLLYASRTSDAKLRCFDGSSGSIIEVDHNSNLIWKYEDHYLHHGFSRLPNGNTIVLRWTRTPIEIAKKLKGGIPHTEKDGAIWSDTICEINSSGKKVWEWKAYESLNPDAFAICPLCFRSQWGEANHVKTTIEGDIIVGFKRISKIVQINKATKEIEWCFGEWPEIVHLHDFSILENGNLLVFEAGSHVIGYETSRSQILEFDLKTGELLWQYLETNAVDFFSGSSGSCQLLPNHNILICEGDHGRIFEINRNSEIVWEYVNPYYHDDSRLGRNNMVANAQRYASDYEGLIFM